MGEKNITVLNVKGFKQKSADLASVVGFLFPV